MGQERTFLGEAALRLQRMLGVTGATSPGFPDESKIIPVVSLGDGTLPGYGGQSLRRFMARIVGAPNVGQVTNVAFRATVDCIITHLEFNMTVAGVMALRYFGPSDALPWPVATANGVSIDRAQTFQEASPLLGGFDNTGIAPGGGIVSSWNFAAGQVGPQLHATEDPLLLAAGATLMLTTSAINVTVNFNARGMILTGS